MRNRYSSRGRRIMPALLAAGLMLGSTGCSLEDLVKGELPPTSIDPEYFQTEDGALALYRGSIWAFRKGFGGSGGYIIPSAHMTDELVSGAHPKGSVTEGILVPGDNLQELDSRTMEEDQILRSRQVEGWYRDLNMARNQAMDGIYYLSTYTRLPKDLVGHLYAIRGYTMVFLAEAFCSGIPLTDYKSPGGMEYKPGSTTEEVYTKAIAQFDTALANMPDSTNYRHLATIGKARAMANLGKVAEAAQLVKNVPTNFAYKARYAEDYNGSFSNNYMYNAFDWMDPEQYIGTIADRKGSNGLPYVSGNDPRVPVVPAPMQSSTYPDTRYVLPAKMLPNRPPWNGLSTKPGKAGEDIIVASGIEARLFEAEAAAAAGSPDFLTILNTLRTTCVDAATCANPAPAGTGGVAGLPPLTDPGNNKARLKMVFDERAYWTFMTGQRQGALRRMVRVHGFSQDEVYPTGPFYWGGKFGEYTNIPIPGSEGRVNKLYKGCFDRKA